MLSSDTFVVEALLNLSHGNNTPSHSISDTVPLQYSQAQSGGMASVSSRIANASTSISSMQMRRAVDIVQRYHNRGNILPHQLADRQNDPVLEQEHLDAQKLSKWRQSVKGN